MQPAELKNEIKGTALERTKRAGLIRNACHVLSANQVMEAIPELQRIVSVELDPVVKQAAEHALERLQLDRS
jgi:epoxyqueuosine reductase QueG